MRQLCGVRRAAFRDIDPNDVRAVGEAAADARANAGPRDRARGEHVRAGRDRGRARAGRGSEVEVRRALLSHVEVDAAAVARPENAAGIAVERGDLLYAAAIGVHREQLGGLIGRFHHRESTERDLASVGREDGIVPRPFLRRETVLRAGGDVDGENARRAVHHVRIPVVDRGDDDRLAVGRPIPTDRADLAVESRADAPLALRDLARRAAVCRDGEEMEISRLREPDTILAIVQRRLVLRRGRPVRPRRWRGHVDGPGSLHWHQHAEPDRLAVGRPPDVADVLIDARDLRRRPFGLHPANEELRAAWIAALEIGDARAVGRPAGAAAFVEKAVLAPVRVHDPQLGVEAILELVDVSPRVDDLRAVGRDLRIRHLLEVEILLDGEERVGSVFLSEKRRARRQQHQ